jgi:hypothetical protein
MKFFGAPCAFFVVACAAGADEVFEGVGAAAGERDLVVDGGAVGARAAVFGALDAAVVAAVVGLANDELNEVPAHVDLSLGGLGRLAGGMLVGIVPRGAVGAFLHVTGFSWAGDDCGVARRTLSDKPSDCWFDYSGERRGAQ